MLLRGEMIWGEPFFGMNCMVGVGKALGDGACREARLVVGFTDALGVKARSGSSHMDTEWGLI